MISGPMPSPGNKAIFMRLPSSFGANRKYAATASARQPCDSKARILSAWRSVRPMSSRPLSRQCLRNGVDLEGEHHAAVGVDDHLPLQVDGQLVAGNASVSSSNSAIHLASPGSRIGSRPFLKQLLKKMSAKLGAISARKPKSSSAHGACSRELEPQPKLLAREQDRRALVARLVQHEVRVQRPRALSMPGFALVEVAPFVEQVGAEAGALDRLQELLGDDRVGVDVGAVQRRDQPGAR
jgi:hypothetical protein